MSPKMLNFFFREKSLISSTPLVSSKDKAKLSLFAPLRTGKEIILILNR